jgi:hypothetical protein
MCSCTLVVVQHEFFFTLKFFKDFPVPTPTASNYLPVASLGIKRPGHQSSRDGVSVIDFGNGRLGAWRARMKLVGIHCARIVTVISALGMLLLLVLFIISGSPRGGEDIASITTKHNSLGPLVPFAQTETMASWVAANDDDNNDDTISRHDATQQNQTTLPAIPKIPACFLERNCSSSGHTNIVYLDNGRQAGLGDITCVLTKLATLAESVCAKLVVPLPHVKLSKRHNHFRPLPTTFSWTDYVSLKSNIDGSDMLLFNMTLDEVHQRANTTTTNTTTTITRFVATSHGKPRDQGALVWSQYQQVRALAAAGRPFIWGFISNVYRWQDSFDKHASNEVASVPRLHPISCDYVRQEEVPVVQTVKLAFMELANISLHDIGYTALHVRRGDAIAEGRCDTSIETMLDFVSCLYSNCTADQQPPPLVIFTDEQDPMYLSSLLNGAQNKTRAIHGDPLVQQAIERTIPTRKSVADNYFLFGIAYDLLQNANVSLRKERNTCQPCIDLCHHGRLGRTSGA